MKCDKFNSYLSDLVVEYLKLHDIHWNVVGKQFVEVHKYTEGLYESLSEKFDEVAERMIMSGHKPVSTSAQYLELADIKELDKAEYRDSEALEIVLADLKALRAKARELRLDFDEAHAVSEANLMDSHIEYYDKEIWFLSSMLK